MFNQALLVNRYQNLMTPGFIVRSLVTVKIDLIPVKLLTNNE